MGGSEARRDKARGLKRQEGEILEGGSEPPSPPDRIGFPVLGSERVCAINVPLDAYFRDDRSFLAPITWLAMV